jgi:hypothetical protein
MQLKTKARTVGSTNKLSVQMNAAVPCSQNKEQTTMIMPQLKVILLMILFKRDLGSVLCLSPGI